MKHERRIASRCRCLLLSGALAVVLAAGFGSTAFAKGDGLPLNVRIVGSAGVRSFEFVRSGDLEGALAFNNQLADLEQLADWLVFGSGRPGRAAPWPSGFYEIGFTQPLAAGRFPWNGMPSPQFYFYPAHGSTAAYVRLHVTRGSQSPVDGWLPARPEFTELVAAHLNGLSPLRSAPQPAAYPAAWWWLGTVPLLIAASVVVRRRIGYFIPVVAMPRTK
jgi:hypothetical protein